MSHHIAALVLTAIVLILIVGGVFTHCWVYWAFAAITACCLLAYNLARLSEHHKHRPARVAVPAAVPAPMPMFAPAMAPAVAPATAPTGAPAGLQQLIAGTF
jgi:hypothetical protein